MSLQGLRRANAALPSMLGSHKGANLAGQKAGGESVPPGAEARKRCTVVNVGSHRVGLNLRSESGIK